MFIGTVTTLGYIFASLAADSRQPCGQNVSLNISRGLYGALNL